ncbi:hypothetical protein D3C76_1587940 [compost metagenome]
MQVKQLVNQSCATIITTATLNQVVHKVPAITETQLTTLQPLAQAVEFDLHQFT